MLMKTGVDVTTCSIRGRRPAQEDRYVSEYDADPNGINGWLMAVFDGHSGEETAQDASQMFAEEFIDARKRNPKSMKKALLQAVISLVRIFENREDGSTVAAVYVPTHRRRAYVAWLGDSFVVAQGNKSEFVTSLHNSFNREERLAAIKRGAVYDGVTYLCSDKGWIMLTRSLGDHGFPFLFRVPEVHAVPLSVSSAILLGSDGLITEPGASTVPGWIRDQLTRGASASEIVDAAKDKSLDNITAIVWRP